MLSGCHFGVKGCFCCFLLVCKLLYKHDLSKRWGTHCKMCSYCLQTSPKLVQNHFGGKMEEFCSEECMSKFTVLFYQVSNILTPSSRQFYTHTPCWCFQVCSISPLLCFPRWQSVIVVRDKVNSTNP